MNIEEERKAFEKACHMPEGVSISNPEYFKLYRDAQFEIWIKAKEHAAEMVKPIANIIKHIDGGHYWTSCIEMDAAGPFSSRQLAIQSAIESGYRVIE